MTNLYNFYQGKRVLITGHTGFKGSWLAIWLQQMGAIVAGIAQEEHTDRDNYVLSQIGQRIDFDTRADIRNGHWIKEIITEWQPDIIFHLAAQPLVRLSYTYPLDTFETNVMGTINVMEAMRVTPSVKVGVMITTDKCYENKEQLTGYREDDPLGGYDPYSASKGAAEIAIASWRRSFFNPDTSNEPVASLASVRAGNVIGGGDWSTDRIIPDCIRAIEEGKDIEIRSPKAVRPWQHVLEPLSGYLLLAKTMWENPTEYNEAWNFGPEEDSVASVWDVASKIVSTYGKGQLKDVSSPNSLHEAKLLTLNINKVKTRLNWKPKLTLDEAIQYTVEWYKHYHENNVYDICTKQIEQYMNK